MMLEPLNVLAKKLKNLFHRLYSATPLRETFSSRKTTLLTQIDFLIDTLSMNKLDIIYMENLKLPLSPDERLYFMQQLDRINSSIKILLWMRDNVVANESFWKKFLRW